MMKSRAALLAAAFCGVLAAFVSPASAQGYGPRGEVYGAPQMHRPQFDAPPPRSRVRPVDPYYGNAPSVRKYGHGPSRHWRRWSRQPHPGWRNDVGMHRPGWDRPRYFDHR